MYISYKIHILDKQTCCSFVEIDTCVERIFLYIDNDDREYDNDEQRNIATRIK